MATANTKPTPEQIANYLKTGGVNCLFCNSHDITGDSIEVEAGICWQPISCNECGAEWQDTYHLVGIAVDDAEVL